jgi:hypothetical protein
MTTRSRGSNAARDVLRRPRDLQHRPCPNIRPDRGRADDTTVQINVLVIAVRDRRVAAASTLGVRPALMTLVVAHREGSVSVRFCVSCEVRSGMTRLPIFELGIRNGLPTLLGPLGRGTPRFLLSVPAPHDKRSP